MDRDDATDRAGEGDLPLDEFRRRVAEPIPAEEMEEMRALIRWFSRRYPTPKQRLDYVRRKYREWTRYRGTRDRSEP